MCGVALNVAALVYVIYSRCRPRRMGRQHNVHLVYIIITHQSQKLMPDYIYIQTDLIR